MLLHINPSGVPTCFHPAPTSQIGLMFLAMPFALPWPRKSKWLAPTPVGRFLNRYATFHYTHQLLWMGWVICLFCHPYAGLPHHLHTSRTWIFISGPLAVYLIERAVRLLRRNVRATVGDEQQEEQLRPCA